MTEKDELSTSQNSGNEDGRWSNVRKQLNKAADSAGVLASKGTKTGSNLLSKTRDTTQTAVAKMQRKLGEDYFAILAQNPLVTQTLSRAALLNEDLPLLATAFNIPWLTTLFLSTAAGTTLVLQRPIAQNLGQLAHYGPGHASRWQEINRYMDSVAGSGHRLKFGHSLDHLPQVIEKFGVEGVPAFTFHLLQDFTTLDGIPIVPNAWETKQGLQLAGLSRKMATGLVSFSFSSLLGALAVVTVVNELSRIGTAVSKKRRVKEFVAKAVAAQQNLDFKGALANYAKALDLDRQPTILMAMGQVAMQRQATRYQAHRLFEEAVTLLADQPGRTVLYHEAQISLRGLAGVYALATVNVLENIERDHWHDHLTDLVNAAVFSFKSAADQQVRQTTDLVPDVLVTPALFSAALNYYLAARTAALYPNGPEQNEMIRENWQAASRALRLVGQYDETNLGPKTSLLYQLWTLELLPPNEADLVLTEG
ncbi:MAG: hypothetical protein WAS33_15340 [Candidatus Promineifilaceae bacterium]